MKKILLSIIIATVIAGSGAFYAGMQYAKSKSESEFARRDFDAVRNLSQEERQQRFEQMSAVAGAGFAGNRTMNRENSGFAAGEIISKDDQSITIKLRDGGSKIIFYSNSTEINKTASGTLDDLEISKSVVVTGTANQDGSITAQSIGLGQ